MLDLKGEAFNPVGFKQTYENKQNLKSESSVGSQQRATMWGHEQVVGIPGN